MGSRLTGIAIAIAVALLLPAGVLAQTKTPGAAVQTKEKAEAKAHYDQGTVHFNLDEWPQAIEDFKAAYRLYPDAIFLYNIAQCHRKMGDAAEALSFYKKYLRERPDAPNRSEVEKRIDELETARAAQVKSREAPPAGLASPNLPAPPPTAAAPSEPPPAAAPSGPPAALASAPAPTEPAAATLAQPLPALGNAAPPVPARTEPAWPGADVTTTAPAASSSILRKWWFWTGVGVVVAAAVIVTAVELSHSSSPSHYQGDMDPPVLTVP
jgi:iron complex outermembrane receptor protein